MFGYFGMLLQLLLVLTVLMFSLMPLIFCFNILFREGGIRDGYTRSGLGSRVEHTRVAPPARVQGGY
jgi:hypothetical protein